MCSGGLNGSCHTDFLPATVGACIVQLAVKSEDSLLRRTSLTVVRIGGEQIFWEVCVWPCSWGPTTRSAEQLHTAVLFPTLRRMRVVLDKAFMHGSPLA